MRSTRLTRLPHRHGFDDAFNTPGRGAFTIAAPMQPCDTGIHCDLLVMRLDLNPGPVQLEDKQIAM
jgi:hypothetical protein